MRQPVSPDAERYKIVWPIPAPPVTTIYWDDEAWLKFAEGFRPDGYEGGITDAAEYASWLARNKFSDWPALVREVDEYGYKWTSDPEAGLPISIWKKEGDHGVTFCYMSGFYNWIEAQRERFKGMVNLKKLQKQLRELGWAFLEDPRHGKPFVIVPRVTPALVDASKKREFADIRDLITWRDEMFEAREAELEHGIDALRHPEDHGWYDHVNDRFVVF